MRAKTPIARILLLGSLLALSAAVPAAASTVWAVGDGANSNANDDAVVNSITATPADLMLYLGDVYETGTASDFSKYYAPSYGRMKTITRPTPGNHEWGNRSVGYDPYWGATYSQPHYYSFDSGGWHLISLNSEEAMGAGSAQLSWLGQDLAKHSGKCTIAYWHRPRYSAGSHGDQTDTDPLWQALAGHASIVLSGHDHNYQRFNPSGGLTQFVVGTGGRSLYVPSGSDPRVAKLSSSTYGALRLTLSPGRADYSFEATGLGSLDAGSIDCTASPSPPAIAKHPTLALKSGKRVRLRHGARKATVLINLSVAAKVDLAVARRVRGGYRGTKHRSLSLPAGSNRIAVKRRGLRAGLYRLTLVATDAVGNDSEPVTVNMRVAR